MQYPNDSLFVRNQGYLLQYVPGSYPGEKK